MRKITFLVGLLLLVTSLALAQGFDPENTLVERTTLPSGSPLCMASHYSPQYVIAVGFSPGIGYTTIVSRLELEWDDIDPALIIGPAVAFVQGDENIAIGTGTYEIDRGDYFWEDSLYLRFEDETSNPYSGGGSFDLRLKGGYVLRIEPEIAAFLSQIRGCE